ncbi:MAG: indolepyruvate oxidoreductase subunit beta [Deltaproteobacteria bacterium]|nr:indolepyruvate oxidoreductase subunit beta [Deltaproteobacteria bacterium]MBW1930533.1 indolepyruvate oxidoreductase subunit beta [Deltaproteobacteria bacterium]MBW2025921.1 indolepyruvate oxidoreductase subunit beta [Deltaproteobacteria bacterium]MBW2125703.1 indolepyruvate oxidoreductase subunit beta [Deltaproteobacteria bacterium]RLB22228.1 MAG: indolepyruvate ferredoxin oxidoreductase [Deltaproteobacteria bacterium]
MDLNVIITGVGGQGNVLASQILGRAAVYRGLHVSIGETFGLSQRGGSVMSHVRLSKELRYSPLIPPNQAHMVVGLEPLETLRIIGEYGNDDTVFIVNSRPIHPLNVIAGDVEYPDPNWIKEILEQSCSRLYWLEATQIAIELGGPIMLNMVMLGALCALDTFPLADEDIKAILGDIFPKTKLEANYRALEMGGDLIRTYES